MSGMSGMAGMDAKKDMKGMGGMSGMDAKKDMKGMGGMSGMDAKKDQKGHVCPAWTPRRSNRAHQVNLSGAAKTRRQDFPLSAFFFEVNHEVPLQFLLVGSAQ
jgi:hypothetical protein